MIDAAMRNHAKCCGMRHKSMGVQRYLFGLSPRFQIHNVNSPHVFMIVSSYGLLNLVQEVFEGSVTRQNHQRYLKFT